YWFASLIASAGMLFLQRTGTLDTRGLKYDITFFGSTLSRLGLKFEKIAVSGYKSAGDQFERTDIAPEARENIEWLLNDYFSYMKSEIALARNLSIEKVDMLVNGAPWTDTEAAKQSFVDKIVSSNELQGILKDSGRKDNLRYLQLSSLDQWLPLPPSPRMNRVVAILPAIGTIIDGRSKSRPLPVPVPVPIISGPLLGDITLNSAIKSLSRDSHIKAVVLHVDSPGGSVTASESIRSSLAELAKKKTLIIYMGDVAASGGYYISVPGRKIVSQPGTLTGSIGVVGGKVSFEGALEKTGIGVVQIAKGERAKWSAIKGFTEEEKDVFKRQIDEM
ncbi:MAG TPA: S49 family peptidase, partial [Candidatus Hodarchaeales archaeon]|nr:S49 family peptidase [Candidatus Hodarchaeales archaeon]